MCKGQTSKRSFVSHLPDSSERYNSTYVDRGDSEINLGQGRVAVGDAKEVDKVGSGIGRSSGSSLEVGKSNSLEINRQVDEGC